MKKRFTKIICVIAGLIAALGITLTAGCSGYFSKKPLAADSGANVSSNGGFAVETDGYVYFINGVQGNNADNTFGKPVKGAIYRISKENLGKRNYSAADCVVPLVAYTADYDAGIFIYGGYVYYATPSTDKSATGQVQSDKLELKRTSLDGSKTMRNSFVQFSSTSIKYRFVEAGGNVYLMYVATSETLFDEEEGVTNLHSVKIAQDGAATDTLLAYNVDTVMFDKTDKTNPRVYYTMNVKNYSTDSDYSYNQVYTVTADATVDKFATEDKKAALEAIEGWNADEEDGETDRYINCGDLVFDGIGKADVVAGGTATPFNYKPDGTATNVRRMKYTLSSYQGGSLFYTRTVELPTSDTNSSLFSVKDSDVTASGWNPVDGNAGYEDYLILSGDDAAKYTYLFNAENNLEKVLICESDGGIYVNKVIDGKMQTSDAKGPSSSTYFPIVKSGDCTVLFTNGGYLYYSVSGGSGYSFWRVDYNGEYSDYGLMPVEDEYDDYRPVQLLDLLSVSDWYMPEIIGSHILFATNTDSDFTAVNYIMAFDLRSRTNSELMDNAAINTLNVQYEGITDVIDGFGDTDKYDTATYANISGAIKYAYYTGESADVYLKELAEECNAAALKNDEDADPVYSEETLKKYAEFLAPAESSEWKDYTAKLTVNEKEVYSNRRDYYYTYVGVMDETEAGEYLASLKTSNLNSMPEKVSWYQGLKTVEKVFFVIGMCLIGLGVIAAVVVPVTLTLVKKRRGGVPAERKKRIKVDTTDDRNIDVYSDGESQTSAEDPAEE